MRRRGLVTMTAIVAALTAGTAGPRASHAQAATSSPSGIQVESVTLARGVKSASPFGQGSVTPVDPATTFVSTDLPYAIIRVNAYSANTPVTLRVVDPTGVAYSVDAHSPARVRQYFEFAAPLYILGTDLESHTGTWHFQVLIDGQVHHDTTFQWTPATASALPKIKAAVDQEPLSADLHWRYGAALAQLGNYSEAILQLQDAIRLDNNYALYHITLGRLYENQGRTAAAIHEFQTALGIHGSFYDAVFAGWAQAHLTHLQGR